MVVKANQKQRQSEDKEMNEMIELTEQESKVKVLIPVSQIKGVVENDDGTAYVETGYNEKRGTSTGLYTEETFVQVKLKLLKLILSA